jgi:hypothetical protein
MILSPISHPKLSALEKLHKEALTQYEKNPAELDSFFGWKDKTVNAEQAAMTVVANAMLNLDEFLTKP